MAYTLTVEDDPADQEITYTILLDGIAIHANTWERGLADIERIRSIVDSSSGRTPQQLIGEVMEVSNKWQ